MSSFNLGNSFELRKAWIVSRFQEFRFKMLRENPSGWISEFGLEAGFWESNPKVLPGGRLASPVCVFADFGASAIPR